MPRPHEEWIATATASGLPCSITGLRREQDVVVADLTLPYSSGVIEGHVHVSWFIELSTQRLGRVEQALPMQTSVR